MSRCTPRRIPRGRETPLHGGGLASASQPRAARHFLLARHGWRTSDTPSPIPCASRFDADIVGDPAHGTNAAERDVCRRSRARRLHSGDALTSQGCALSGQDGRGQPREWRHPVYPSGVSSLRSSPRQPSRVSALALPFPASLWPCSPKGARDRRRPKDRRCAVSTDPRDTPLRASVPERPFTSLSSIQLAAGDGVCSDPLSGLLPRPAERTPPGSPSVVPPCRAAVTGPASADSTNQPCSTTPTSFVGDDRPSGHGSCPTSNLHPRSLPGRARSTPDAFHCLWGENRSLRPLPSERPRQTPPALPKRLLFPLSPGPSEADPTQGGSTRDFREQSSHPPRSRSASAVSATRSP